MSKEHYDAQIEYANILYEMLDVSPFQPIKRFKLLMRSEKLRTVHKPCCEWANEDQ